MSGTQKFYAGIGSRETPIHCQNLEEDLAVFMALQDYVLRSGHAKGSDLAFEKGCDLVKGKKEIFTAKSKIPLKAFEIAEDYHPAWYNCDAYARKLHARNSMIILGENCDEPVSFVIAYAPGSFNYGGTSQGLRIARGYNIPIFNIFEDDVYMHLHLKLVDKEKII